MRFDTDGRAIWDTPSIRTRSLAAAAARGCGGSRLRRLAAAAAPGVGRTSSEPRADTDTGAPSGASKLRWTVSSSR